MLSAPFERPLAGLCVAVAAAIAALLWVPARHTRWRHAQGVLGRPVQVEVGRDPSGLSPQGRGRVALRDLWSADPVELVRGWRLRRRPADVLAVALDLLGAVAAGLEAGLTTVRAVEVAVETTVDVRATDSEGASATRAGSGRAARGRALGPGAGPESLAVDLLAAARAADPARPVSGVWEDWARRCRSADLAFVAAAWRLSESTGAPLADAAHRASRGLRDAARRRARLAAAVAGPRSTVAVLTVLPLAGPLLGLACGVNPVTLYVGSPVASISVLLGAGLAVAGRWWARRMVSGVMG